MRNTKGSRRERELLEKLTAEGFLCHRVAGSGKGETAICDIIAINGSTILIEVKSRNKFYYSKRDINQLKNLVENSKRVNAKPYLYVKLNFKDWKPFDLTEGIPEKVS